MGVEEWKWILGGSAPPQWPPVVLPPPTNYADGRCAASLRGVLTFLIVLGGPSRGRNRAFLSICCVPGSVLGTCFTSEAPFHPSPNQAKRYHTHFIGKETGLERLAACSQAQLSLLLEDPRTDGGVVGCGPCDLRDSPRGPRAFCLRVKCEEGSCVVGRV